VRGPGIVSGFFLYFVGLLNGFVCWGASKDALSIEKVSGRFLSSVDTDMGQ
jgi:hypothetical protein